MKKSLLLIALLFAIFMVSSCEKEQRVFVYHIASERWHSPYDGRFIKGVWLISRESPEAEWGIFNDRNVKGFEYERGYEYVIKVKTYPLPAYMESFSPEYRLVKIINKVKKDSELPERLKEHVYKE
ncbi:hypothetical protein SDC9_53967 [bioreactor metagenome]|uniref:DUF4377 domain-containing protein n=1 Tax=bioreactor metagenome TaxID=1076179 RepID=A0A644WUV4_9ZZZZ